jgi:hypothetical protein
VNPSGSHDDLSASESTSRQEQGAVLRAWKYYLETLGKNPKLLSFTKLRKQKGLARLRECAAKASGDLAKAEALLRISIDGLAKSDFHRGANDRQKRFDSWEKNLFANQEQLERWLEKAE